MHCTDRSCQWRVLKMANIHWFQESCTVRWWLRDTVGVKKKTSNTFWFQLLMFEPLGFGLLVEGKKLFKFWWTCLWAGSGFFFLWTVEIIHRLSDKATQKYWQRQHVHPRENVWALDRWLSRHFLRSGWTMGNCSGPSLYWLKLYIDQMINCAGDNVAMD